MNEGADGWYFAKDGHRHGMFPFAVLKEHVRTGNLLPGDFVWKTGMDRWVEARTINGLFNHIQSGDTSLALQISDSQRFPRYTVSNGIVICDKDFPGCRIIQNVQVAIHGFQAQLKTLDDVKQRLVIKVKAVGGNGLVHFTYGQRSNWITTLLGGDNVSWYGAGTIIEIPEHLYQRLIT